MADSQALEILNDFMKRGKYMRPEAIQAIAKAADALEQRIAIGNRNISITEPLHSDAEMGREK